MVLEPSPINDELERVRAEKKGGKWWVLDILTDSGFHFFTFSLQVSGISVCGMKGGKEEEIPM